MRKGFTVGELFLVLFIILVLTAILYPVYERAMYNKARYERMKSNTEIPARFTTEESMVDGHRITIIKDSKTGKEFMKVDGGNTVTLKQ